MSWAEPGSAPVRWPELEEWLDRTEPVPRLTGGGMTGWAGPMALAGLVAFAVRAAQPRR